MLCRRRESLLKQSDKETIRLAVEISTQRSYADIITSCRQELCKYFGFEGLGLLFRDTATNDLFSVERDFSQDEEAEAARLREKKRQGKTLSDEERLRDLEFQLRPGTKNNFPNSLGITGEVYHSREIYYESEIKKAKSYVAGLDNQSKYVKEVSSILVTPIYGHKNDDGSDNLVGIAQFVNKINGRITEKDKVSLLLFNFQ